MKKFTLIVLLNILFFSVKAQSPIEGTYQFKIDVENANLQRTMIINSDSTFVFHGYEYHITGIPQEKSFYGKGTWTSDKNIIIFTSNKMDFDEKHKLDFTNTKARFTTKSPRDTSDRDIKTSIRFYESEIFWIEGLTLLKLIN